MSCQQKHFLPFQQKHFPIFFNLICNLGTYSSRNVKLGTSSSRNLGTSELGNFGTLDLGNSRFHIRLLKASFVVAQNPEKEIDIFFSKPLKL